MPASATFPDAPDRIAIVGTGLLGASVGLGLKAAGFTGRLVGFGRTSQTVHRAVEVGAIDEAAAGPAAVRDCQLLLVCVPLGAFAGVFQEVAPYDHDALVATDVGSTKSEVVALADRYFRGGRFVGSHPMAGSEQQGPDAARADLFRGKPCVLTPQPQTDPRALRTVEALWTMLGMKLLRMSAEDHDRAVASVSHLPHAASVALMHAAMRLGGFAVASTGFRDTTRLASSNPPMRSDIMLSNRAFLLEALAAYRDKLDELQRLVESGDGAKLLSWLTEAQRVRDDWMQPRED